MKSKLVIATGSGIHIAAHTEDGWEITHSALQDHAFTAISASKHSLLAGAKDGLYLSLDEGRTWEQPGTRLADPHIRAVWFHPNDDESAFAGTEPAALYISRDGGVTWEERTEVTALREKHRWSLPYSPNAGCVRGFAFAGTRGYAAVEVGGLLRTDDSGRSWHLMSPEESEPLTDTTGRWLHPDVHSVKVHASSQDRIFVPTGGGFYTSDTGGQSWSRLHGAYCRAAWIDPEDPAHIILGPAAGPDRSGRIEETRNAGRTWENLPTDRTMNWQHTMVEQFVQMDDLLLAALSDGAILSAELNSGEMHWRIVRELPQDTRGVAAGPLPEVSVAI